MDERAAIVTRAWSDEAFKARLLDDATAVLAEADLELPPGVTVKTVEDTESIRHLVLPVKPTGDLSDEELETVAAAGSSVFSDNDSIGLE